MPFLKSFSIMMEILKSGNVQFIVSTHSPILMGFPGARIYEIQEDSMQQVNMRRRTIIKVVNKKPLLNRRGFLISK